MGEAPCGQATYRDRKIFSRTKTLYGIWTKRQISSAIVVAMLFLVFGMPAYSHAGLFSFLGSLFEKSKKGIEESVNRDLNSQTVSVLRAALSIDPNPYKGGGEITIVGDSALLPDAGPLGTIADVEDTPKTDQISIYVVREGDSLSQIAEMFGVSVNTVIWANNIRRGDLIQTGQTLIILPVSGVRYTVKTGDTLVSIAKTFKGDIEEIKQFNDLGDEALTVGTIVMIPNGEVEIPVTQARGYAIAHGVVGPSYSGYYIRPVLGGRTQGLHGFNAVDLAAYTGEPVVGAAGGSVIIAKPYGWNGGYGAYVVIAHPNGTQTLYAHLQSLIVSPGSQVVQGQVIGYAGATGRSTGPHLHFEIRGAKNPF